MAIATACSCLLSPPFCRSVGNELRKPAGCVPVAQCHLPAPVHDAIGVLPAPGILKELAKVKKAAPHLPLHTKETGQWRFHRDRGVGTLQQVVGAAIMDDSAAWTAGHCERLVCPPSCRVQRRVSSLGSAWHSTSTPSGDCRGGEQGTQVGQGQAFLCPTSEAICASECFEAASWYGADCPGSLPLPTATELLFQLLQRGKTKCWARYQCI